MSYALIPSTQRMHRTWMVQSQIVGRGRQRESGAIGKRTGILLELLEGME